MILLEITKVHRPVQKKEWNDALSECLEKNGWDTSVEEKTFVDYGTIQYAVVDTDVEGEVHAIMENWLWNLNY